MSNIVAIIVANTSYMVWRNFPLLLDMHMLTNLSFAKNFWFPSYPVIHGRVIDESFICQHRAHNLNELRNIISG